MRPPSSPPTRPRRTDRPPRSALAARAASAATPPPHERDFVPICGLAAVQALVERDPRRIERLFFEPRFAPALLAARRLLAAARKPYREVAAEELARIAGTVRHAGVVAIARPRPLADFDSGRVAGWARSGRLVLVLDGVGNPHNLGAIVRSAVYFGVEHVILADRPEQAFPSAASYRIAEGALESVTLHRAALATALPLLQRHFRLVGSALAHGTPLASLRGGRPVALVLGNEELGIDPATLALCDTVVTIPGAGSGVQSLNVAAAAAVMLYALCGA
ncbi:MAG: RNA methyltransferase [Alphaproteobacteria bacterium]|nr:RNA methyltransferase [Alphaproteobacteria bacterium]